MIQTLMNKFSNSFDISGQLKIKTKIFDLDPIGEKDGKSSLIDHFENLAKNFNEKKLEIMTSSSKSN